MFKYKILIVHNYYQIPGGEDTVVHNEKLLLESNGHEVILYTRDNDEIKEMSLVCKMILPFSSLFSLRTYKEISSIINDNNIDIIHVHNTLNLISPSVYYAALKLKKPVVQTIHNFRFLCPGATFYRNNHICEECVERGLYHSLKYRCYRNSFFQTLLVVTNHKIHRLLNVYRNINFICLTEFNKYKFLQLNKKKKVIDENRVYIKPNFVANHQSIIPLNERKNQFVYAGRIDNIKGIKLLFEAWVTIKDFNLIVCGTGPEEEWCRNFIKNKGVDNIIMMGFVLNSQVLQIISESKALVLPTQWFEGFPMIIAESISLGTPVIGSDLGNVGNIIKEGVNGVKFKSDSIDDLRRCIYLLGNSDSSIRPIINGLFLPQNNYMQLYKIYENVSEK